MSQKVIGLEERSDKFHESLFEIEQLLGKSPNSKLERIDQFEKEQNALNNKMKQCRHAQDEANVPQIQELQLFMQKQEEL